MVKQKKLLLLGGLGLPELIAIIVVVLLFFGARRIPELMKSMGKGVRSFKEGVKGLDSEMDEESLSGKDSSGKDETGKGGLSAGSQKK